MATPLIPAKNPVTVSVCMCALIARGQGQGYEGVACAPGRTESVERRGPLTY